MEIIHYFLTVVPFVVGIIALVAWIRRIAFPNSVEKEDWRLYTNFVLNAIFLTAIVGLGLSEVFRFMLGEYFYFQTDGSDWPIGMAIAYLLGFGAGIGVLQVGEQRRELFLKFSACSADLAMLQEKSTEDLAQQGQVWFRMYSVAEGEISRLRSELTGVKGMPQQDAKEPSNESLEERLERIDLNLKKHQASLGPSIRSIAASNDYYDSDETSLITSVLNCFPSLRLNPLYKLNFVNLGAPNGFPLVFATSATEAAISDRDGFERAFGTSPEKLASSKPVNIEKLFRNSIVSGDSDIELVERTLFYIVVSRVYLYGHANYGRQDPILTEKDFQDFIDRPEEPIRFRALTSSERQAASEIGWLPRVVRTDDHTHVSVLATGHDNKLMRVMFSFSVHTQLVDISEMTVIKERSKSLY